MVIELPFLCLTSEIKTDIVKVIKLGKDTDISAETGGIVEQEHLTQFENYLKENRIDPEKYDIEIQIVGKRGIFFYISKKNWSPKSCRRYVMTNKKHFSPAEIYHFANALRSIYPKIRTPESRIKAIKLIIDLYSDKDLSGKHFDRIIESVEDIPQYEGKKKLDPDLESIIRPISIIKSGTHQAYIVFTYNKHRGIVRRYRFWFAANSSISIYKNDIILLGQNIGDYFLLL